SAAKQVDVSKVDKSLNKAISQATRVVTSVSRAVADEINRMSTNNPPPWRKTRSDEPEGASEDKKGEDEGYVWASHAQQSEPERDENSETDDEQKVRVETEPDAD
ncbi:MAG: hypothetical protein CSA75_05715, partial [Sorangium cellulosum]